MIEELLKTLSYDNRLLRESYLRIQDEIFTNDEALQETIKLIDENSKIRESTPVDDDIESLLLEEKKLNKNLQKLKNDLFTVHLDLDKKKDEISEQERLSEQILERGYDEILKQQNSSTVVANETQE